MTTKPSKFSKADKVWYHKDKDIVDEADAREKRISILKVEILDVHFDDFPNIYYTVRMLSPPQFHHNSSPTISPTGEGIIFHTEKQTDESHLFAISSSASTTTDPRYAGSPRERPNPLNFPYCESLNLPNHVLYRLNELALAMMGDLAEQEKMNPSKILLKISGSYPMHLLCLREQPFSLLYEFLCLYYSKEVRIIFKGKMLKDGSKPLWFYFGNSPQEKLLLL